MSQSSFSSTPTFAPGPSHSFTSASVAHSSSLSPPSGANPAPKETDSHPRLNRAASPLSSSSSVASTASSSSPSSCASSTSLMMSSVLSEEDRERGRSIDGRRLGRSAQGSVGSLATTASPGPEAIKEEVMIDPSASDASHDVQDAETGQLQSEGSRRRSASGSGNAINLSSLSIRQDGSTEPCRIVSEHAQDPAAAGARQTTSHASQSAATLSSEARGGVDTVQADHRGGEDQVAAFASSTEDTSTNLGPASANPSARATPNPTGQHPSKGSEEVPAPARTPASTNHVDIVSYPPNDLLRLLASLLEQIAQANDERNVRVSAAAASTNPVASSSPPVGATPSGSAPSSLPSTRRNSLLDDNFTKGRFDAAPLNSPVTPHHSRRPTKIGGSGGPGILDNAFGRTEDSSQADQEAEMPLTPGVDLLREVGEGRGVEGFMPSLGGTHQPMPLGRRRGSSFLRNKRPDELGARPANSRQSSSASSVKHPSHPSPSSSNDSSPAPTRPSSATPQGVSPLPSPPNGRLSSTPKPSEPPLTSLFSASSVALSSPNATLGFHARNVPAISIEAYLLRILKYCPTTNEVFLALLVYFDRMARIGLEAQRLGLPRDGPSAGQDAEGEGASSATQASKLFAIDSFNVHRLVIAGVTVASKFFSDVFYTNSRYAKVGGLPLHELNQLELQFLLLNDFRLKVPTDELQRYADQLILFWIGRNGTSNPPAAAAAAKAAASSAAASRPPSPAPHGPASSTSARSAPTAGPRVPTPTHAPGPSSMDSPAQLTHSAVAAHHESSSSSAPAAAFRTGSRHHPVQVDPRTPTMPSASTSTSTARPHVLSRPRSVRSQPSSSGTSVTSTITPGTPSTTRGGSSSDSEADEGYDVGDARVRARGRYFERGRSPHRIEPASEDGHFHDGWSTDEASSRDSSAEREERDRREVHRKLEDRMQED